MTIEHVPAPSRSSARALRGAVEEFLFDEAELLDTWQMDKWLALFDESARYEIPCTDASEASASDTLFLISDDMTALRGRVERLQSKSAWVESPWSRTRRLVTNVRVTGVSDDVAQVTANFAVYRMKSDFVDVYVGHYELALAVVEDSFRFRHRKAVLDLETLRPAGKISILL